jgi:hypothetical protein
MSMKVISLKLTLQARKRRKHRARLLKRQRRRRDLPYRIEFTNPGD